MYGGLFTVNKLSLILSSISLISLIPECINMPGEYVHSFQTLDNDVQLALDACLLLSVKPAIAQKSITLSTNQRPRRLRGTPYCISSNLDWPNSKRKVISPYTHGTIRTWYLLILPFVITVSHHRIWIAKRQADSRNFAVRFAGQDCG